MGDLGLPIGLPAFLSPSSPRDDDLRDQVGRVHALRGRHRAALPRQRRPLPVRIRGDPAGARRQRDDPTPPRHRLGLSLSVPRCCCITRSSTSRSIWPPELGVDRHRCRRLYRISRLHEGAVHLTDRYFNRDVDAAERGIAAAIHKAERAAEIDRLLADGPTER